MRTATPTFSFMDGITGRDGYIIAKALAYAIETIERLPDEWQEFSDKEDMKMLFDGLVNNETAAEAIANGVRHHLRGMEDAA